MCKVVSVKITVFSSLPCRPPRAKKTWDRLNAYWGSQLGEWWERDVPTSPPVLQTHTAPDVTASSSNTVASQPALSFTLRTPHRCKHKGENVILTGPLRHRFPLSCAGRRDGLSGMCKQTKCLKLTARQIPLWLPAASLYCMNSWAAINVSCFLKSCKHNSNHTTC